MSDCPESPNGLGSETWHTSYINYGTDTNAARFLISLPPGDEKMLVSY